MAQSPEQDAASRDVSRYDAGWRALNTLLNTGRSLSGHERNCCFLNTGGGRFADLSAVSGLDFSDDGRVLALTDWDCDGDIDFWVANRTGPQARFLRNNASNDHHFLTVRLEGTRCNRDAIGARLELYLAGSTRPQRIRTLRAGSGYLSQSSKWVHFGLGSEDQIDRFVVRWPDGQVQLYRGLQVDQWYKLKQDVADARPWQSPPREVALSASLLEPPASTDRARIVLLEPIPVPEMSYTDQDGNQTSIVSFTQRPRLINLWTTWCTRCLRELTEWSAHQESLDHNGLEVLAINVDETHEDIATQRKQIANVLAGLNVPFRHGFGTSSLVEKFDVLQRAMLNRQRPLPIPSSFLVDGAGRLRVIYKGPVSVDQLVEDSKLIDAAPEQIVRAAAPLGGKWLDRPAGSSPMRVAMKFVEGGFVQEAKHYIQMVISGKLASPRYRSAGIYSLLGALLLDQREYNNSETAFREALKLDPEHRQTHIELGGLLLKLGRGNEAANHFEEVLSKKPDDPEMLYKLGWARLQHGATLKAVQPLRRSVELRPNALGYLKLGNALAELGKDREAVSEYQAALALRGDLIQASNNLAWILATSADDGLRDGKRAVSIAERICSLSVDGKRGEHLDTLAAAFAASGRFAEAVQAAEQAIQLTRSEDNAVAARSMEARLLLYRQNKAFHDDPR